MKWPASVEIQTAKNKSKSFTTQPVVSVVGMYKNKHVSKAVDDTNRLISHALRQDKASKSSW